MVLLLCVLLSGVVVDGIRVIRSPSVPTGQTFSGSPRQAIGSNGQASALYTFGAPGATAPALTNPGSSSGCFKGLRVVSAWNEFSFVRQQMDPVPPLTRPFGYEHAKMPQAKIFVDKPESDDPDPDSDGGNETKTEIEYAECGEKLPDAKKEIYNPLLHLMGVTYVNQGGRFDLGNVANTAIAVALNVTTKTDQQRVADSVRNFGWNLIDSAAVENSAVILHDSISHLIQEPMTKACFLTFRGSRSIQDWVHNVMIVKVPFCGLSEEGTESGTFAHKGFRDHLRHMVRSSEWQTRIRPHLGACSEVILVGHSLGGAAAGLFAACAAKAPKKGEFGFVDDFEHIGWTVEEPRTLPAWSPEFVKP